mgnify:CR=1 FL=1
MCGWEQEGNACHNQPDQFARDLTTVRRIKEKARTKLCSSLYVIQYAKTNETHLTNNSITNAESISLSTERTNMNNKSSKDLHITNFEQP